MSWSEWLQEEKAKPYFKKLSEQLKVEYSEHKVYPNIAEVYSAFKLTSFDKIRVVILGQDPYHGPGQAHGLAFSVRPGVSPPPSLVNIYKELARDMGIIPACHGYLKSWAEQGVLLLNTTLTVREGSPGSHSQLGWEELTDSALRKINECEDPKVFLLWGAHARRKGELIDPERHLVLETSHPSPLSVYRGFHGCGHFSTVNEFFESMGQPPIQWRLPLEVK